MACTTCVCAVPGVLQGIYAGVLMQTRLTALDLIGYAAGDERPRQFVHMPEQELEQELVSIKVITARLLCDAGIPDALPVHPSNLLWACSLFQLDPEPCQLESESFFQTEITLWLHVLLTKMLITGKPSCYWCSQALSGALSATNPSALFSTVH